MSPLAGPLPKVPRGWSTLRAVTTAEATDAVNHDRVTGPAGLLDLTLATDRATTDVAASVPAPS
jgi:hypothetical protein